MGAVAGDDRAAVLPAHLPGDRPASLALARRGAGRLLDPPLPVHGQKRRPQGYRTRGSSESRRAGERCNSTAKVRRPIRCELAAADSISARRFGRNRRRPYPHGRGSRSRPTLSGALTHQADREERVLLNAVPVVEAPRKEDEELGRGVEPVRVRRATRAPPDRGRPGRMRRRDSSAWRSCPRRRSPRAGSARLAARGDPGLGHGRAARRHIL